MNTLSIFFPGPNASAWYGKKLGSEKGMHCWWPTFYIGTKSLKIYIPRLSGFADNRQNGAERVMWKRQLMVSGLVFVSGSCCWLRARDNWIRPGWFATWLIAGFLTFWENPKNRDLEMAPSLSSRLKTREHFDRHLMFCGTLCEREGTVDWRTLPPYVQMSYWSARHSNQVK